MTKEFDDWECDFSDEQIKAHQELMKKKELETENLKMKRAPLEKEAKQHGFDSELPLWVLQELKGNNWIMTQKLAEEVYE